MAHWAGEERTTKMPQGHDIINNIRLRIQLSISFCELYYGVQCVMMFSTDMNSFGYIQANPRLREADGMYYISGTARA